jgi:hypothetical protein
LGIPVFTYHSVADPSTPDSVTPTEFELHMRYLAQNGYHTLSADDLYDHLVFGKQVPPRSVVITFDDGRATIWTVAFSFLQKYNFKAVSFIVPSEMSETGIRPTLSDYKAGQAVSLEDLLSADSSGTPTITWEEARIMHDSGLVDFQSHTLDHTLIYSAPEIVDFINPTFAFGFNNCGVPVIRYNGVDRLHSRPPLGTPVYSSQPRMSAARRFFDDEGLRRACVEHVDEHGGEAFFAQRDWRTKLLCFVKTYHRKHEVKESLETVEEQAQAIRYSLIRSRQLIEEHLPGHSVRHLCYPWHRYSMLAARLAGEAGYVTSFIDINPQKPFPDWNNPYLVQRVLPLNEYGDDPYQITRIDARDNVILSLPGRGRLKYVQRFALRFLRTPGLLKKLLQKYPFRRSRSVYSKALIPK